MSETPPGMASSWVDLTSEVSPPQSSPPHMMPGRVTPPHCAPHHSTSDYLRMLREAQSCESSKQCTPLATPLATPLGSTLVSGCSTCRNSGTVSPKSPPNSPNVELEECEELETIFVNRLPGPGPEVISEFLWDWSSRPSNTPPKWPQSYRTRPVSPSRNKKPKYTGRAVASILLSNLVSLLLGAGLGVWLYRRTALRGLHILIA